MSRNGFRKKIESLYPASEKQTSFLGLIIWAARLSRPYKKLVMVILLAMLLETLIGLATPWPLKIIIDNVVGHHALPGALAWMNTFFPAEKKMQLAAVAAISFIAITAIGSFASLLDNYYNEKVAQFVANDMRKKMYHHLQHLSL